MFLFVLIVIVSFTAWFFYGITLSGLLYLKIKKPELHRPYKVSVTQALLSQINVCVTIVNCHFVNTPCFCPLLSQQVPIILPVLVLIVAVFLVLAPIIDNPQIEYLYVTLFIASGAIAYVPFIHYQLCPGLLTKLTVFLQLFLEVAPAEKNL